MICSAAAMVISCVAENVTQYPTTTAPWMLVCWWWHQSRLGRSMMCYEKIRSDFCQILRNSRPNQSKHQCTLMVWGTVFTNDCCSRLMLGPWPRSGSPSQATYTLGACQTSIWCVVKKLGQILVRSSNSRPNQSKHQCTMPVCSRYYKLYEHKLPVGRKWTNSKINGFWKNNLVHTKLN